MYHSVIEMDPGHVSRIYLFGVLCSNACYVAKIHGIGDLQKRLMQACLTLSRTLSTPRTLRTHAL